MDEFGVPDSEQFAQHSLVCVSDARTLKWEYEIEKNISTNCYHCPVCNLVRILSDSSATMVSE